MSQGSSVTVEERRLMIEYFLAKERGDLGAMRRWSNCWLDMMETRMAYVKGRMRFDSSFFRAA
jgi:hypothetical protein